MSIYPRFVVRTSKQAYSLDTDLRSIVNFGAINYLDQSRYNISQEICTRFCCALLCCGYAIVHNEFTWSIIHIHQGCFAGTGAIVRLPQCQWSKPDGYGKISQCITTTKHSKANTVCIFLGIYCTAEFRLLEGDNGKNRTWGHFYQSGLILIQALVNDYTHYKAAGAFDEDMGCINNFIPLFTLHVIIYSCWN